MHTVKNKVCNVLLISINIHFYPALLCSLLDFLRPFRSNGTSNAYHLPKGMSFYDPIGGLMLMWREVVYLFDYIYVLHSSFFCGTCALCASWVTSTLAWIVDRSLIQWYQQCVTVYDVSMSFSYHEAIGALEMTRRVHRVSICDYICIYIYKYIYIYIFDDMYDPLKITAIFSKPWIFIINKYINIYYIYILFINLSCMIMFYIYIYIYIIYLIYTLRVTDYICN